MLGICPVSRLFLREVLHENHPRCEEHYGQRGAAGTEAVTLATLYATWSFRTSQLVSAHACAITLQDATADTAENDTRQK
jgi:hypothetical protein